MLFAIKKASTSIILPPGIFIVILLLLGLRLMFSWRRTAGFICIVLAVTLYGLSVQPLSARLVAGLEARFPIPENPTGDAIVLLGGGHHPMLDRGSVGVPKGETWGRIFTAARLQKDLKVPLIVSSGSLHENTVPGAEVDKRFLMELGVDQDQIILETRSRDTYENAKYTKIIAEENVFESLILVSSPSHLWRAVMIFEKLGMTVTPYPVYENPAEHTGFHWTQFLPRYETLFYSSMALHEYLGYLYYRLIY